uniref:uncharacterized protein LOC120326285 n=1 Tax=Styela clava TaxID=7725 RepID=UPI0019393CB9|nr:uncharacterized protein LOC120326285 [Styela clava]
MEGIKQRHKNKQHSKHVKSKHKRKKRSSQPDGLFGSETSSCPVKKRKTEHGVFDLISSKKLKKLNPDFSKESVGAKTLSNPSNEFINGTGINHIQSFQSVSPLKMGNTEDDSIMKSSKSNCTSRSSKNLEAFFSPTEYSKHVPMTLFSKVHKKMDSNCDNEVKEYASQSAQKAKDLSTWNISQDNWKSDIIPLEPPPSPVLNLTDIEFSDPLISKGNCDAIPDHSECNNVLNNSLINVDTTSTEDLTSDSCLKITKVWSLFTNDASRKNETMDEPIKDSPVRKMTLIGSLKKENKCARVNSNTQDVAAGNSLSAYSEHDDQESMISAFTQSTSNYNRSLKYKQKKKFRQPKLTKDGKIGRRKKHKQIIKLPKKTRRHTSTTKEIDFEEPIELIVNHQNSVMKNNTESINVTGTNELDKVDIESMVLEVDNAASFSRKACDHVEKSINKVAYNVIDSPKNKIQSIATDNRLQKVRLHNQSMGKPVVVLSDVLLNMTSSEKTALKPENDVVISNDKKTKFSSENVSVKKTRQRLSSQQSKLHIANEFFKPDASYSSRKCRTSKYIRLKKLKDYNEIVITIESVLEKKHDSDLPRHYNFFNAASLRALISAFEYCKKHRNCKAVLVSSVGPIFCSGLNPQHLLDWTTEKNPSEDIIFQMERLVEVLANFDKPIVGAVQGPAIGFGASILLFCDSIYASKRACFQWPGIKIGLPSFGCTSSFLPKSVGIHRAKALLMEGIQITATEAKIFGLVNEVFPHDTFMQYAVTACQSMIMSNAASLHFMKQSLNPCDTKQLLKCNTEESARLRDYLGSIKIRSQLGVYISLIEFNLA